jgi:tRNA/rRNA methyltransferase
MSAYNEALSQKQTAMTTPAIILCRPQLGENIGAAARAMNNFGLSDLRIVGPRDAWPNERAYAMAVTARPILDEAKLFDTLHEALADLNVVYATTARDRGITKEVIVPEEAARRLRKAKVGDKLGILFGNERAGLENDDVSLADAVITIPTAEFASLNLGQAVLLCCYEWFKAEDDTPPARIEHNPLHRKPRREELFQLFDHLEGELTRTGFMFPPDKRDHMKRAIRATIHRAHLTYQEVQTVRGMIVALARGKHRGPPKE